jgi:hypothetical protein
MIVIPVLHLKAARKLLNRLRLERPKLPVLNHVLATIYPNYRHVIPPPIHESVTIPEDRRPALIAWLRSLGVDVNHVRLSFETPGHLTLTHGNRDQVAGSLQVPITIQGQPAVMCFDPKYLADALEFGATLRLGGDLHLGMVGEPSGEFCLLMSRRDSVKPVSHPHHHPTQAAAIAA